MNIFAIVFLALFGLIGGAAQAKTSIVFVNGINNDDAQARAAGQRLKSKLYTTSLYADFKSGATTVAYWNNPTSGFNDDQTELIAQARLSHDALSDAKLEDPSATQFSPRYQYHLGRRISNKINDGAASVEKYIRVYSVINALATGLKKRLDSGDSIVLVAHSQGNFFAEEANAYLRYKYAGDSEFIGKLNNSLRYVGVASVAMTTPNNRYVTVNEDNAVLAHIDSTAVLSNFHVLQRNSFLCNGLTDVGCQIALRSIDFSVHAFDQIYLNDGLVDIDRETAVSNIVVEMIEDSVNELKKNHVESQAASVFDEHLGTGYFSGVYLYSEISMLQVDLATGTWRSELYEPTVAGKWHRFLETDEAVLGSNGWEIAPRLSGSYVTLNSNSIRLSSPYFNGGTLTMTASGARDLAGLTLRSEMPGAESISPDAVFPAGAKSYTVTEQSTAVSYFLGWSADLLYATNLTDLVNRYRTGGTLERLPFEGTGSDTYVMSFAKPAFNLNGGVVNFWHASNLEVLVGTGHYKVITVAGQQLLVVDVVPAAVVDSSPFYREEYAGGSRPIFAVANVNGVTGAYRGWSWGYGETYVQHNRIALDAMLNAVGATCPLPDFNQTSTCADGSSGIASAGLARAQSLGAPMRARNRAR